MSRRRPSAARNLFECGRRSCWGVVSIGALLAATSPAAANPSSAVWNFTNVTVPAGFNYSHGYTAGLTTVQRAFAGGVAAGDYNGDRFVDLYVVRGDIGPNLLFRNQGDGTFVEVGAAAGVNVAGSRGSGPAFADYDGDGRLDLFIGGIETTQPTLFRNLGNGTFQNVTATCGISYSEDTFSAAFGDHDRDGDIDLFLTHFGAVQFTGGHLWRNNGNGTFTEADAAAGFTEFGPNLFEYTYAANFADINSDDWPDILISSDFGTSEVYQNDGDGTFTNVTTSVITDENGMGSAVGDYDNDGDLDWFVSSIWDSSAVAHAALGGTTGNRMYRNDGTGTFTDATDAAGVRAGYWGWGASFADFNNDRHLDLVHVNGWGPPYEFDPARFFVSNGNGTFTERSAEVGVNDTGRGLGVVCFDYDRDGDMDLFMANNSQPPKLFRNNGGNTLNYLSIKLNGGGLNTEGIGARILVTAGGVTQMRELRSGCNFVSQDPTEAHFGLGAATIVQEVRVEWPTGQVDVFNNIPVNIFWKINQTGVTTVLSPDGGQAPVSPFVDLGSSPNPFASETTIRFKLGADTPVALRIFDAAGRAIRTLVDGRISAGDHAFAWNGRDAAHAPVAAGIYFYRLDALDRSATGRLAMIR